VMKVDKLKILHNNRCGKSRAALLYLQENNIDHEVIFYVTDVLSETAIKNLLDKLGLKAIDIVRKNEVIYLENFKGKDFSEKEWIHILHVNPILIERPIIYNNEKAVIARPIENLYSFIKNV
jgi:arsenate reductase